MDVYISRDRGFALIVAAVVVAGFWYFMTYTRTGRAIRAVSQDETGALMVGIGLNGILLLTMSLSCALAAIAGAVPCSSCTLHILLLAWSRSIWPGSW